MMVRKAPIRAADKGYDISVVQHEQFIRQHGEFSVFVDDESHNWMMQQLMIDGAEGQRIGRGDKSDRNYRIHMPAASVAH